MLLELALVYNCCDCVGSGYDLMGQAVICHEVRTICAAGHSCNVLRALHKAALTIYRTRTCRCHVSTTEVRRHVSSMSTLETLQFHFTDLSSDCCLEAMLGNLSNLRTLKTPESEAVTAELVSQVAQLTALQDLDLSSEYVSILFILLRCRLLRRLHLGVCQYAVLVH